MTAAVALVATAAVSSCAPESPDVETIKSEYATPLDLMNARVDCLESKGWVVKVDEQSMQFRIDTANDAEQMKLEKDDADCYAELGVDPNRKLTSAEFDLLYEQYQDGSECLENLGFTISAAPSRQVFADSYYDDPWLPWNEVSDAEFDEAIKVCPMPAPVL